MILLVPLVGHPAPSEALQLPSATRDHSFFLKNDEGLYNYSYIQDFLDYRLGICGK